jgi:hypothetical protein
MDDVPSSTLPNRSFFPEINKKDSQREVLPVPPWPTTAKFLRDLDSYFAMKAPFHISVLSSKKQFHLNGRLCSLSGK